MQKLYHEETGFCLNYLTLQITDPVIVKELTLHRGNQFKRVRTPIILFALLNLLIQIFDLFLTKTGNPMKLIAGGGTFLIILGELVFSRLGRDDIC